LVSDPSWELLGADQFEGLHELDPVFRKATLENPSIKAVARDLKFHHDPVGALQVCIQFNNVDLEA
jgi:hypothetical protein